MITVTNTIVVRTVKIGRKIQDLEILLRSNKERRVTNDKALELLRVELKQKYCEMLLRMDIAVLFVYVNRPDDTDRPHEAGCRGGSCEL